jgi:hypothetical protein
MPVLMEKHRIGAIDLLKCDIEGGEQELFSDCGNWIGSVRAMVIELHDGRSGDWIVQQCRQGGADFELLKITPKTPGISLGWLRRRS